MWTYVTTLHHTISCILLGKNHNLNCGRMWMKCKGLKKLSSMFNRTFITGRIRTFISYQVNVCMRQRYFIATFRRPRSIRVSCPFCEQQQMIYHRIMLLPYCFVTDNNIQPESINHRQIIEGMFKSKLWNKQVGFEMMAFSLLSEKMFSLVCILYMCDISLKFFTKKYMKRASDHA